MSTDTSVVITHNGVLYEVPQEAFEEKPPFRLPDGTIFETTKWSKDAPPKAEDYITLLSTYNGDDVVDLKEVG